MQNEIRPEHLVIGTAGHIDHGKTALIKALTGTDTDRLEEEKRRGITIDLGFAFYSDKAAFIDVPGHERFVKTMVAGASAMQAAMLIIAADDGVMPQTREHLAVLDAMGIDNGIIVITKADLADDKDWIDLVKEEAKELISTSQLAGASVVVVDSISGKGIDELKSLLDSLIENIRPAEDPGFFRMPVDRSFLIKGHGRVVTGTVWNGMVQVGDKVELLPGGEVYRIRGLQAHGNTVDTVKINDRAAMNIAGETEPKRGDLLVSSGRAVETSFLDVKISLLPSSRMITNRMRVRIHLGTSEVIGRVLLVNADELLPGTKGFGRLDLEFPVTCMIHDKGVLRHYSPVETLGGIKVLDPDPPDRKRSLKGLIDRLQSLDDTDVELIYTLISSRTLFNRDDLLKFMPLNETVIDENISGLVAKKKIYLVKSAKTWYVSSDTWKKWKDNSASVLAKFHSDRPEEKGMSKVSWGRAVTDLDIPDEVLTELIGELTKSNSLVFDDGLVSAQGHEVSLKPKDEENCRLILDILDRSGVNVPLPSSIAEQLKLSVDEGKRLIRALKQIGKVIILDERVVISKRTLDSVKEDLTEKFSSGEEFSIADVAEVLQTTRKYVVPLLEYLDDKGFCARDGNKRKITQ